MSLLNLVRRRVHPVTVFCRHGSSTPIQRKAPRILPDEKLRALVSLYHQTDNFITLENLSQRIDDAFTTKSRHNAGFSTHVKLMQEFVDAQRKQPRMTEWDRQTAYSSSNVDVMGSGWKMIQRKREAQVKQALYGLDEKEGNVPGLEIVRDVVQNQGDILKGLQTDASEVLKGGVNRV